MKKLMYAFFIMVLAVSIVGFSSCGNNKESDETTDDTTATETTEEMVDQATYAASWDFTSADPVWEISYDAVADKYSYPHHPGETP